MSKRTFLLLFLLVTFAISQKTAQNTIAASGDGDTLVIRHVAKVPDGRTYELGVEEISNITDLYYYIAEQSPVASSFLSSGYSLADEKNRLIEADVVSNGGKIDLEYTPSIQTVNVTYYKSDGEKEEKIGTITDSAYVGEQYKPQPPVYDGADVLATLIGENDYLVKFGENNFKVTYSLETPERNDSTVSQGSSSASAVSAADGYVRGYPDNTFKPEKELSRKELYSIISSLSGKNANIEDFPSGSGIADSGEELGQAVTWSEFSEHLDALDGIENSINFIGFDMNSTVKRAEAVSVINGLLGISRDYADLENPYTDVFEDEQAYFDILEATEQAR